MELYSQVRANALRGLEGVRANALRGLDDTVLFLVLNDYITVAEGNYLIDFVMELV